MCSHLRDYVNLSIIIGLINWVSVSSQDSIMRALNYTFRGSGERTLCKFSFRKRAAVFCEVKSSMYVCHHHHCWLSPWFQEPSLASAAPRGENKPMVSRPHLCSTVCTFSLLESSLCQRHFWRRMPMLLKWVATTHLAKLLKLLRSYRKILSLSLNCLFFGYHLHFFSRMKTARVWSRQHNEVRWQWQQQNQINSARVHTYMFACVWVSCVLASLAPVAHRERMCSSLEITENESCGFFWAFV